MSLSADKLASSLLELNALLPQNDITSIIEKAATLAQNYADADGVFLYSLNRENYLCLEYTNFLSLNLQKTGANNHHIFSETILSAKNNSKTPVEICALNKEIINAANIYDFSDIDTCNFQHFDEMFNYATVSILSVPLLSSRQKVVGIIQLINAQDSKGKIIGFTQDIVTQVQSICAAVSVAMENRDLQEAYGRLLESFIEVLARAIDAKSPYTGAHCQRVPVITRMLATAAVQSDIGSLKNFEMNQDDWYALHIASWLHDCGKVTTPEYVVDKATKLETIYNRIHEIRNRFEILRRDAQIEYLQKRLANTVSKEQLQQEFAIKIKQLEEDFAFIARCNTGDVTLTPEDIERLKKISANHFMRYFDRMIGLSWAERDAVKEPEKYKNPGWESVLQDRPEHLFGMYNQGELHNLQVLQGTINQEEREKINEHIVITIDMLKALPFPPELSNVVEYAGAHHERVNGKGYPNGLTGDQMSIPAKIMAIADIFEALTSNDRPYKEPKKLSEVLKIMQEMKNEGHIDSDLYKVFILNRVYQDYAEQYIDKSQIDKIIPEEYL